MGIKSMLKDVTVAALKNLTSGSVKQTDTKRYLPFAPKSITLTRQDIAKWNQAQQQALLEEPKNYSLQLLYRQVCLDALLTSLIENRKQQIFSINFSIRKNTGEVDEEQTSLLRNMTAFRQLLNASLDKIYYGYSLLELSIVQNAAGNTEIKVDMLPRTNVVPQLGLFYADYSEDKSIKYREMPEYGIYILEFNNGDLGLLNKAVPHVLFKKFAQSCWSELCEIYGIPPRVMKTNTQDNTMLNRAEQMMKDMGSAAWFIIDETETFEWATGVSTNGDVYKQLLTFCNNELSLLINGAVIGQDTKYGSNNKDQSAQEMLWNLVQADMRMFEVDFNNIILPSLLKLGVLKGDIKGYFEPVEDLAQLWKITNEALQFFTVDPVWAKSKFGIEITGERQSPVSNSGNEKPGGKKLNFDEGFFG
jgi:Protein of unknown function (DUF935)